MSGPLRREVLNAFKNIHRTRLKVFSGDPFALSEARKTINDEYKKHAGLTDPSEIKEALRISTDAETLLRTTVIQAKLKDKRSQIYEVKVTDDTVRNENHRLKVGTVPNNIREDGESKS